MRKVEKDFDNPPPALVECFTIQKSLIERDGRNHRFDDSCWRNTLAKLRVLYFNKCAYCEKPIMPYDNHDDSKDIRSHFTVEHYRPKDYYYWLAYEWSNLLLLCKECNPEKGNKFPFIGKHPYGMTNKMKYLKHPIIIQNQLDLAKCRANHKELVAENPSLLHPEIDEPELYLTFSIEGKIKFADKKLSEETEEAYLIRQQRAEGTILISKLNRFSLNEVRLKLINDKKNELENILIVFYKYANDIKSDSTLKMAIALAFFPFLTRLKKLQDKHQPYSLLGKIIFDNYNDFFIQPFKEQFGDETAKLLRFAFYEFQNTQLSTQ